MKPRRSNPLFACFFRSSIVSVFLCSSIGYAATKVWNVAGPTNNWNLSDLNWDAGVAWTNANDASFTGADTVTLGADAITAGTITVAGTGELVLNGTLANLSFTTLNISTTGAGKLSPTSAGNNLSGGTINIASGATLYAGSANTISSAINVQGTGNTENRGALRVEGNAILSGPVTLLGTTVIGGGATGTISGVISDGGNAYGLTSAATFGGTVVLSGANTYTGTTTLSAGKFNLGVAETAGTSGPLGKSAAANPGSIVMTGGTLQYSAANQNDYSGRLSTAASQQYKVDTNGQTVTWATPLTSSGGTITKTGTGTLILSGPNNLSGATAISGGTLSITGTSTLAGVNLTGGSTLNIGAAGNLTAGAMGFGNTGTNLALASGGVISAASVTCSYNPASFVVDGTLNSVGTFQVSTNATTAISGTGTINATTLNNSNSAVTTYSVNRINIGTGGLVVASGSVTLNGTTLGASADWSGGALTANGANAINTLDSVGGVTGRTVTLTGNLSGTGSINLPSAVGSVVLSSTAARSVTASLTGSTPITKSNTGTTVMSGANNLSGGIAVTGGRLDFSGTESGASTVVGTTTLGGEGSFTGGLSFAGANLAVNPVTPGAMAIHNPTFTGTNTVVLDSVPTAAQVPVQVFTYTGTLTGILNTDLVLANAAKFNSPVFTDNAGVVTLSFGTQALTWAGAGSVWDVKTAANWAGSNTFAWGDSVLFDDTVGAPANITLTGELQPASIVVNTNTNNYTITGSTGNFISGSTSLLKSGTSTLTMNGPNTFTGGVVISNGTIQIQSAGALGAGNVTLGDVNTGSGNTALYIDTNRVNFVRPVVISANGSGTATLGTRSTVTGAGGSNGFNGITLAHDLVLDSNAADRTDYQNISGTGNITISGAGRTVFTTANTFTGNLTISPSGAGGHFQNGVATASATNYIPDASNVTVTDFTGATQAEFRLSSQSETINGLNGNGTIDTNSINTTLTLGGGNGNGSFSGTIQNGGAYTVTLTKNGTGTQVLSGANSYTGVTTISGGVLQFGTTASLYNNDQLKWTAANLIVASGAIAAFNVGGAGEFTSSNIDAIRVLSNVATGTPATTGFKSGSSIGLDTTNASGGSFTYSSVIANHVAGTTTDTLGVAKLGAGTLVLSGASTYSGATTAIGGTLEMTNGPVRDSAFVVRPGGTLKLGYSLTGTGYSASMTVQGAGTSSSNGLYILRGKYINRNTMFLDSAPTVVRSYGTSGRVTINGFDNGGNNFRVYAAASGSSSDEFIDFNGAGGGGNSYGYTMTVEAGTNSATGDFTINGGIINGGGGFTKAGGGSLVLAGQCSYTSALKIALGSVITSGSNLLSTSAGVSIGSGSNSGKLVLLGSSQTVPSVVVSGTGTGNRVVGGSSTLSTLTVSNTTDGALSAIVGGAGTDEDNIALAKSGTGVLTLSNPANSYTGGTTVNGGTLRVNDASGTVAGTGTITVNSGGTLDGYGNLNVGVIVSATGGTVAGGELGGTPVSGDTLSVDSLTFQDTGALSVAPGISSIDVTNDLTVSGGTGSVAVNIGTAPLSVGTYTLVTHGALSGTGVSAFAIGTNPGGPFTYTLSDNGGELQLTVATSALFWNGNNGDSWSAANNWKNGSGSAVSFSNGTAVVFNDDATSLNVDLSSVDVSPLSVTFANSSSYDYTLAGSKAITGSAALLKSGTGSVTLNNTNSFTGDVTINQGTLNASSITDSGTNSALGMGSTIILGGGTLGYTGASAATTDRSITANATSTIRVDSGDLAVTGVVESTANLNKTGPGTLVLDNAANYIVGSLSISGGAVQVDEAVKLGSTSVALAGGTLAFSGSAAITASQAVSFGAGGGVINVTNTDANGVTLSGAITGSTGLTKNGTGKLTLSNNKNFAGGVTVNNGTLFISGGGWYTNPFGQANTITINPGGKVQTAGAHSLGVDQNTVHINGGTLQLGAEQYISGLQMTGGLLTGGQLRTWGGTMTFNASATGALIDSPSFQMVGAATLNVADGAAADDLTVSSGIFGSVGLIKSGDGKLVLQGINTHTGNTNVNAGTLQLKDDARLTFVIPASGASNKITGAGTAELDGDFQINTTAAAALTTGTWTLEDVTGTATYGSTFQVVESTGTPWTSSGDKWTKVSGTQLWTFDETTGVLTLTIAGYDAWASAYGLTGNDALRTSDPDNDGFSNLQEFLFGASPVASTGSLVTMSQSGGNLVLTWLQRETGSAYQLKESATLANGSWTASSLVPVLDDQTGVATDYDRWKVTITPASGKAFFRVEGTEN